MLYFFNYNLLSYRALIFFGIICLKPDAEVLFNLTVFINMEELDKIIIAGIAGTAVMSFFTYLFGVYNRNEMKMIGILGTLITFQTTKKGKLSHTTSARISGTLINYLLGVTIAVVYLFLWTNNIGRPDYISAVIFGCVLGILAILGLKIIFAIHPNPPALSVNSYISALLLGNIIYSLTVVFVYLQIRYW